MQVLVRNLFGEIRAGNSSEPKRELETLVRALIAIGPDGWYYGKVAPRRGPPEDGLTWIWNPPETPSDENGGDEELDVSTVRMFQRLPLDRFNLSRFKLQFADFRESRLTEANFSGADLEAANFTSTCAKGPNFDLSNLERAIFTSASISDGHFESSNLQNATADKALFLDSHFEEADLDQIKMTGVRFSRSKFMGAHIRRATLQTNFFDGADFTSADLSGTDLDFSQFEKTVFREAKLVGASLRKANLSGADMSLVDLNGADLSDADLREANLSGAKNLQKVRNISGANLMHVKGLSESDLRKWLVAGAVLDKKPRAPIVTPLYPCASLAPHLLSRESSARFTQQQQSQTSRGKSAYVENGNGSNPEY
jgi:uncharacterized protein YjbI with pentapeptide repeats